MPLVSVVMPSYNHERFISQSINSVLGQDVEDFELIIIDDASDDMSQPMIEGYAAQDPRIEAIFHDCNMGMARTFNEGLEKAKGRFVAQQASDDVWVRDKLRKQLAIVEEDEDLVVWSEGTVIDAEGRPTGKSFSEYHNTVGKRKSGAIFQELLTGNYIFGSSLLTKRSNLAEIRYDESLVYMTDYKFALDLARKYAFCYLPEPLVCYRIHGDNTIMGSSADVARRQRVARSELITVHEDMLRRGSPDVSNVTLARVYAMMGLHYRYLGESAKAMRAFCQAIKQNPLSSASFANGALACQLALSQLLPRHKHQDGQQT